MYDIHSIVQIKSFSMLKNSLYYDTRHPRQAYKIMIRDTRQESFYFYARLENQKNYDTRQATRQLWNFNEMETC